jgi:hypothetical protein
MENHRSPVATRSDHSIEMIDFILKQNVQTTLIICATRSSFLADLQDELQRTDIGHLSHPRHYGDSMSLHPLLSPTLYLLATTKRVHVAFTPTLAHLRAYLSTFPTNPKAKSPHRHKPSSGVSVLVILSLVALHRPTSEYSAQGLSRTLAIAVETARLANMKLVLVENDKEDDNGIVNGIINLTTGTLNRAQQDLWKEQVPILSGSIRFGNGEGVRAGRTVDVGRVLGRWCRFGAMEEIFND